SPVRSTPTRGRSSASRPAAPAAKPKAETVEPLYKPDGTPCCPVHKRPLSDGQYGLYGSDAPSQGKPPTPRGIARYALLRDNDTHCAPLKLRPVGLVRGMRMANEDHVNVLRQGVNVWNAWRDMNGSTQPDLSEADFSEADLSDADFSGANLTRAI